VARTSGSQVTSTQSGIYAVGWNRRAFVRSCFSARPWNATVSFAASEHDEIDGGDGDGEAPFPSSHLWRLHQSICEPFADQGILSSMLDSSVGFHSARTANFAFSAGS
jgi:hypothetical protein